MWVHPYMKHVGVGVVLCRVCLQLLLDKVFDTGGQDLHMYFMGKQLCIRLRVICQLCIPFVVGEGVILLSSDSTNIH